MSLVKDNTQKIHLSHPNKEKRKLIAKGQGTLSSV